MLNGQVDRHVRGKVVYEEVRPIDDLPRVCRIFIGIVVVLVIDIAHIEREEAAFPEACAQFELESADGRIGDIGDEFNRVFAAKYAIRIGEFERLLLVRVVHEEHIGHQLHIAIHELAPNLSFVLAPLICEVVLYWYSWRAVFRVMGILALVLPLVFARFGRGGEFHGEPVGYTSYRNILSKPAFWVMVLLFSLGISSTMGIYSMLSLYLVAEHGMERNWANTLIALSRVASIGVTLAGGWATDRFGPRLVLRIVFLLTGLMTIFIGMASTTWVTVAVFLQPIMAVCFFPAGLAALSMVSSSRDRNIAVSLTVPLAFMVGGGATPTFVGYMGDVHSFGSGIALVGGAILTGAFIS